MFKSRSFVKKIMVYDYDIIEFCGVFKTPILE